MNKGKFIDRNPDLRAAGITKEISQNAGELIKIYTIDELAEYKLNENCQKLIQEARRIPTPSMINAQTDEVAQLLSPELQKTRFVTFREKFSENMYFFKPELGKALPALTKPDYVTNYSRTFGAPNITHDRAYDLILPKKTRNEVNREFLNFHSKKLISHRHFLPAERINRHYKSPPFNANDIFGISENVDKDGNRVKRCMEDHENTTVISKVQNDFLERTRGALGKKIKSLSCKVTDDMIMGRPSVHDLCDVKAILENTEPCVEVNAIYDAIVHLNKLRRSIFERSDLHINDLRLRFEKRDLLNNGYLPLAAIAEVARRLFVYIDVDKIRTVLKQFHMLHNEGRSTECVKYVDFCKLLQVQFPLPAIGNVGANMEVLYSKDTTYRDMCKDILRSPLKEYKGIESLPRANLIALRMKEADKTTAKDVVSPDIPTRIGLMPSDFEMPRGKGELRRVFQRILCDDKFEEAWKCATELFVDTNDLFTVNELRLAMNVVLGRIKPEELQLHKPARLTYKQAAESEVSDKQVKSIITDNEVVEAQHSSEDTVENAVNNDAYDKTNAVIDDKAGGDMQAENKM